MNLEEWFTQLWTGAHNYGLLLWSLLLHFCSLVCVDNNTQKLSVTKREHWSHEWQSTLSGHRKGGAQRQVSLKNTVKRSCAQRNRVSTSSEVLKPSQLDNELIKDWRNWLWASPPNIHLTATWCHSREECSQAFPIFTALLLLCITVNTNRRTKTG